MLPKRPFYFLRHGQTDWNLEGRYQGHCDAALNATGIAAAAAAAQCLAQIPIDRVVASPLVRARTTASIVAAHLKRPIHWEVGLVEGNFGSCNGKIIRDVKARHGLRPDQSSRHILPGDADPCAEIFERIPPVIARGITAHPDERLLLVAHSGVFDALHPHAIGPRSGEEALHAVPYRHTPTLDGWQVCPARPAIRKPMPPAKPA
jgi:broad specificity phosphatase PhoE